MIPESTIVRRGPAFTLYERVFLSLSPHTCTLCPVFFDPSIPLWLASYLLAPAGGRTHLSPIARFAYLCRMIGEETVLFFFLYIKLLERGVEVALNNRFAVTHYKVNLLKFSLRSSIFERTDDAFVLLICFYFFHL